MIKKLMLTLTLLIFLTSMSFGGIRWNVHVNVNDALCNLNRVHLNHHISYMRGIGYCCSKRYCSHNTYGNQILLRQIYLNSLHNKKFNKKSNEQIMEDIEQLYVLYQEGIITKKEYDDAKKALLNELK